jgi:hypothetical protein
MRKSRRIINGFVVAAYWISSVLTLVFALAHLGWVAISSAYAIFLATGARTFYLWYHNWEPK